MGHPDSYLKFDVLGILATQFMKSTVLIFYKANKQTWHILCNKYTKVQVVVQLNCHKSHVSHIKSTCMSTVGKTHDNSVQHISNTMHVATTTIYIHVPYSTLESVARIKRHWERSFHHHYCIVYRS
jgi:hypothetical protein